MPKRAVLLCLLLFSLSVLCSAGPDAWCLAPWYEKSLKTQLLLIIKQHPQYLWGGSSDLNKGLDCSGYVYLAARWAGIPGVTRTTSLRMAQGFGGWTGKDVDLEQGVDCDLLFWTFAPNKPFGHVGFLVLTGQGRKETAHASPRLGVVLRPLRGSLKQNLIKVRRLTIGE
jgi:cell wall-associated NlpC family hydrolase